MAQADADEDLDWAVSLDSTFVRAHQYAAGPRKGALADEPGDCAIGRSRGGLTADIHLAAGACCRPLAFVLTAEQAGEATAFTDVMARLRVPR
ncbi:hypothetical protein GCM10010372_82490 [Streptomyces tauricus]|uniref:hypothetical protein n=1 Tax=Streptomyces tauricus TaxID=68274 RepID=UPI00167C0A60|nr:hypothetical protein [Streptomyces tauricus]GHA70907.1 hypothetical protein GCM10010372_82490 [Streptomyces tauricus]